MKHAQPFSIPTSSRNSKNPKLQHKLVTTQLLQSPIPTQACASVFSMARSRSSFRRSLLSRSLLKSLGRRGSLGLEVGSGLRKKQNISANFLSYIFIHFPHSHWLFHWTTCGLIVTGSALKGLAVTSPGKHRGEARVLSKRSFHVVCFHLPIQPAHAGSGRTNMRSFRKMQHATLLHWCQVAIILGQGLSKLAGLRPWFNIHNPGSH